jgi:CubicO group peptidase (beta-lactamase class C family)
MNIKQSSLLRFTWTLVAAGVAATLLLACIGGGSLQQTPTVVSLPSPTGQPEVPPTSVPAKELTANPAVQPLQPEPATEPLAETADDEAVVEGELGARLDHYLTQITPFGFSGAVLVASDGEVVLNKGYGMAVKSQGTPNTSQTVFSVGSITKQFTAAAIMKLEMDGKLSPSDLIGKYLDGVPEDKAGITLHHLLTHSSGVIEYTDPDYEPDLRDETVKSILDAPLKYTPGEQFLYSNAGYTLLAAIVEKVSGQPYEVFLREELFTPAGMAFTGYRLPDWSEKFLAHWYRGDIDNGTPLEKPYPFWNLIGNGGILSTTEDMYRWHLALERDEILSKEAKMQLYTPFLNKYAYGWAVSETEHGTLIRHNGGSGLGNSADFVRYVDADVTIVLFANQSHLGGPLALQVIDKIETLAFDVDVAVPPDVDAAGSPSHRKFAETYQLTTGGRLKVSVEDDVLLLTGEGQDAIDLLTSADADERSLHADLNARSLSVLRAVIDGDLGPLGEARAENRADIYQPGRSEYDVRRFMDRVIRRGTEITGDITDVIAVGTVRSAMREDIAETTVEFRGDEGSIFFRLVWRNGEIIGLDLARSGQVHAVPLLPLSESEFAGYNLAIARNVRASFVLDGDGVVVGLTVHAEDGDVDATRL